MVFDAFYVMVCCVIIIIITLSMIIIKLDEMSLAWIFLWVFHQIPPSRLLGRAWYYVLGFPCPRRSCSGQSSCAQFLFGPL
jgi:hypothetical protein